MIHRTHNSVSGLRDRVVHLLDRHKLDQALRMIHDFVEQIFTEPLCVSQVYGSRDLDDLCRQTGRANFLEIRKKQAAAPSPRPRRDLFVYIVTKLEKSGGLRQVIEDFIHARPQAQHLILSTELEGRSDTTFFSSGLGRPADVVFKPAPKGDYQQRLTWLQIELQDKSPGRVYLFNHHQDSVAVAAIQPEMGLDGSFYHHGDHHLCLGVFLPYLEHIDPHPMGYYNCREVLGINNTFIPLVAADQGPRPDDPPFMPDGTLTTCTAARSNKIELPYFVNYLELIPALLKITGGRHIHIGRLTPWALFKMRRGLKRNGLRPDQLIYTPWVPSVWKTLHEFRVDLYIASFPYGGGLTLVEAMGAGVPVALHRHIFSRVLSGLDLAYPEAFSWRYPKQLMEYCASLTADILSAGGRLSRGQYERFHRREILRMMIDGDDGSSFKPFRRSEDFPVDHLEKALWMENQVNIRKVVYRTAYRQFRRLRGRWGMG